MRLSRSLSDLVKYTKSVRVHDIETQGKFKHQWSEVNIQFEIFAICVSMDVNRGFMYFFCLAAFANSWQVSSLNETVMNQILQLKPGELVRFNQRQLLRVYPSNYRVDSSNFNPQPYWNAGCHMGKTVTEAVIPPTFTKYN